MIYLMRKMSPDMSFELGQNRSIIINDGEMVIDDQQIDDDRLISVRLR